MITERLTKLDEPKRKTAVVLVVLVVACICYFAITRDSVTKLKAANASYAGVQAAYAETENQQTDLLNLQKQLGEKEKQLQEYQQQYFGSKQALQFFENINAMALAYNLKPISRIISEPEELSDNKADDEKSKPKQQFLEMQSVKLTVAGSYIDIVDFLEELTDRPQKVCITNLHVALPPGEKLNPRASFSISVLIHVFDTPSGKTSASLRNELASGTLLASSEIDTEAAVFHPTMLRNPMQFASATTAQDEAGKLIVTGILYIEDDPSASSASICNQVVHQGEKVLDATVVKINRDSVEFEMGGKRWTQTVQQQKK